MAVDGVGDEHVRRYLETLARDVRTVTGRVPVPLREFAERERAAWERGPGAPEHPAAPERNGGAP